MKSYFFPFVIVCTLLTNCYTYNKVNNEQILTTSSSKTYELYVAKKDKIIARGLSLDGQNYYTYIDKKNNVKSIPKSSVLQIKERKFSWEKTIGLVLGSSAIITGIIIISLNNMKVLGNDFKPRLSK